MFNPVYARDMPVKGPVQISTCGNQISQYSFHIGFVINIFMSKKKNIDT